MHTRRRSINLPIPFPDLLHEFSVQTNAIPASNGESAGEVVNIVTNSGTNAFRGDLFEFLRNGTVNAKNYFASTVDQLKRNQFGGSVGRNPFRLPSPPPKNFTFVSAGQYINLPLKIHPTYFQQWNWSLQQQFGPDWLFSLNYI